MTLDYRVGRRTPGRQLLIEHLQLATAKIFSDCRRRIYLIRGQKVMIDTDLAELYEVSAKRFNEQVRRKIKRFPEDFMFQLTMEEGESLRSQFATKRVSNPDDGPETRRLRDVRCEQIAVVRPGHLTHVSVRIKETGELALHKKVPAFSPR